MPTLRSFFIRVDLLQWSLGSTESHESRPVAGPDASFPSIAPGARGQPVLRERPRRLRRRGDLVPLPLCPPHRPGLLVPGHRPDDGGTGGGRHPPPAPDRLEHGPVRPGVHGRVRDPLPHHLVGERRPLRQRGAPHPHLRRARAPHGDLPRGDPAADDPAAVPRVPVPPPPRALRPVRRARDRRRLRARVDAVHRADTRVGARGRVDAGRDGPRCLAPDRVLARSRAAVPARGPRLRQVRTRARLHEAALARDHVRSRPRCSRRTVSSCCSTGCRS